jgi:hypothetical protein
MAMHALQGLFGCREKRSMPVSFVGVVMMVTNMVVVVMKLVLRVKVIIVAWS